MIFRRSALTTMTATVLVLALAGCTSGSGTRQHDEGQRPTDRSSTSTSNVGTPGADDSVSLTTSVAGGSSSTAVTTSGAGTGASAGVTAGADDTSTDPNLIDVTVNGGVVEGGVQTRTVRTGAQVTLRVTSDASDVLHVQGYELKVDVIAGQSTDLTFLAKSGGSFRVELEKQGKLLDLVVRA